MENNIQESYCSFEVSKLLKEKGFDVALKRVWSSIEGRNTFDFDEPTNLGMGMAKTYVLNPTHALAIEWIRVNFGIMIFCDKSDGNYFSYIKHEDYPRKSKLHINWVEITNDVNIKCDTTQQATEAALLYTLTNLTPNQK